MSIRVRVGLACKIAGLNRDRFNEAVHANNYPCAPVTAKGATRVFDEADLIALYLYARLLEEDVAPRRAGALACLIGEKAKMHPSESLIHVGRAENGAESALPGSEVNMSARQMAAGIMDMSLVISVRTFNVGNVRDIIRKKIEEEKNILGREDDEP
jgi:hypothetical protein